MSHFPPGYYTVGNVAVASPPLHTGDIDWAVIPSGSTGLIQMEAGATYRVSLSGFLATSQTLTDAWIRIYETQASQEIVKAHTNQASGDWRTVIRPVSPGAVMREYRLEQKIDNASFSVTVTDAYILVERIA
jgi:hypothetical protein